MKFVFLFFTCGPQIQFSANWLHGSCTNFLFHGVQFYEYKVIILSFRGSGLTMFYLSIALWSYLVTNTEVLGLLLCISRTSRASQLTSQLIWTRHVFKLRTTAYADLFFGRRDRRKSLQHASGSPSSTSTDCPTFPLTDTHFFSLHQVISIWYRGSTCHSSWRSELLSFGGRGAIEESVANPCRGC